MADTEERQFNSLAERIAALNQQRNFTAPTAKRPPPPPPCTCPLGRTVPLAYNAPLYPYAVEALEGVDRADMLEGGERVGEGGGR